MHDQLEANHPFAEGNGRTGRILIYLNLSGLLKMPAIYLSEYIIQHKTAYHKKLREYNARVSSPGTPGVTIAAEVAPGKMQTLSTAEFRVKRIPDPIAKFADKTVIPFITLLLVYLIIRFHALN